MVLALAACARRRRCASDAGAALNNDRGPASIGTGLPYEGGTLKHRAVMAAGRPPRAPSSGKDASLLQEIESKHQQAQQLFALKKYGEAVTIWRDALMKAREIQNQQTKKAVQPVIAGSLGCALDLNGEYKEAIEQSKERTEPQAKQKAVLQNLRMQINRLRQKGEDTEDLLLELRDKEKSYERGKNRPLGPTTSPRSAHNPLARATSERRCAQQ